MIKSIVFLIFDLGIGTNHEVAIHAATVPYGIELQIYLKVLVLPILNQLKKERISYISIRPIVQ